MRKMRQKDIAALIERDLLKAHDAKTSNTTQCFSCGRGIIYKASRFCSQRCRDWYDSGNPGHAQDWLKRAKVADASTPDGYVIRCAHCQTEFESGGLPCCSTECERRHRKHQNNLKLMAEVGSEPSAKRKCEHCGAVIPNWRKGRRVSRATRFCSDRCSRKATRSRLNAHSKSARAVTHSRRPSSTSKREKSNGLMGLFFRGPRDPGSQKITDEHPKRVRQEMTIAQWPLSSTDKIK